MKRGVRTTNEEEHTNREKKEFLKKTPEERRQIEQEIDRARHQSFYDGRKYPELFLEWYDSPIDRKDREAGISTLKKEVRDLIRYRLEYGVYPERLHYLALAELRLKHPEE